MNVKAYPAYRESRIEWIGPLPEHWDAFALKRDIVFITSGSRGWAEHYADEGALFLRIGNLARESLHLDLSDIQRVSVPDGSEGERTRVRPGDLLFSITAFIGSVAIVPDQIQTAYVSQHVALARLHCSKLTPRWVGYAALSAVGKAYLDAQCYGGTKIQLGLDDVANLPVPVPPLTEQLSIAAFLDRETGKIDALVAEQERLIALLKEKQHALLTLLISEAEKKFKKIELGRVLVSIEQGWSPLAEDREVEPGEWGVLKLSSIKKGQFIEGQHKALPQGIAPKTELALVAGDVLLSRANTPELVGDACLVKDVSRTLMLSDLIYRLRPNQDLLVPEFLILWLLSPQARNHIQTDARGSSLSMVKISHRFIRRWALPLPTLYDQAQIVAKFNEAAKWTALLTSDAQHAVVLLRERRAALISAAVTGKIDVRDHATTEQATAA